MPHFLLKAGTAAFALTLMSFAGVAGAAPHPALDGAAGLMILTGDEENSEVQNLIDPESDNGTPMGQTNAAPPPPEGEHAAAPQGESGERALESTVGGDGINAIQRESIPEKNGN